MLINPPSGKKRAETKKCPEKDGKPLAPQLQIRGGKIWNPFADTKPPQLTSAQVQNRPLQFLARTFGAYSRNLLSGKSPLSGPYRTDVEGYGGKELSHWNKWVAWENIPLLKRSPSFGFPLKIMYPFPKPEPFPSWEFFLCLVALRPNLTPRPSPS